LKKLELLYQGSTFVGAVGGGNAPGANPGNPGARPVIIPGRPAIPPGVVMRVNPKNFVADLIPSDSVYTPEDAAATRQKVGKLTDAVLKGLKDATGLEDLAIASDDLTNEGLEALSGLKNLKKIHLGGHNLTGGAFKPLTNLTDLTVLDGAGLTPKDQSIPSYAGVLKDLAQLKKLELTENLPKAEAVKVAQLLTKIKIESVSRPEVDGIRLGEATPVVGGPGGKLPGAPGGVVPQPAPVRPAPGLPGRPIPLPAGRIPPGGVAPAAPQN
jgi:hypothetical protein